MAVGALRDTAVVDLTRLDPRLISAVTQVVRLVADRQEQLVAERADRATREVKPQRPAIRRLYDIRGAADQLSLSESKVWELIKDARLLTVKVDGRTLVKAGELDRFAEEEARPG
jgi:hypothetical protein